MLKRLAKADILITSLFLVAAIAVVVQAQRWPFRSALFPLLAGWVLLAFSAWKLAAEVVTAIRPAPALAPAPNAAAPVRPAGDEDDEDAEEEDVFQAASAMEWGTALTWMGLFFLALWLLGALVGIPLFALAYLLVASRESPVLATTYAFACWAFVYGLFDRGLHVPLPAGVLLTMLGQ